MTAAVVHDDSQGTWQFMSTRMLTKPGARHTISDDLESHFFVLMWTALHRVKHNRTGRPRIKMEFIFDQQSSYEDGEVMGGAGKVQMYESRDSELLEVEFSCKPFNDLFWALWTLFSEYLGKRRDAARNKAPGEQPF